MQIEDVKSTGKELSFTISGASTEFVNAVRRIGMSRIPVFGIDKVTVYDNTSSLFDDYLANRVGLIPVVTPDGYSAKDVILFSLDKSGPGTVYSKSLKSSDGKVEIANDDIPIIKLAEEQQLRIEAKARLGTAIEHARFQPGIIAYEQKGDNFHVIVESFGQLSPKDILLKAADVLEESLSELKEAVKKVKD